MGRFFSCLRAPAGDESSKSLNAQLRVLLATDEKLQDNLRELYETHQAVVKGLDDRLSRCRLTFDELGSLLHALPASARVQHQGVTEQLQHEMQTVESDIKSARSNLALKIRYHEVARRTNREKINRTEMQLAQLHVSAVMLATDIDTEKLGMDDIEGRLDDMRDREDEDTMATNRLGEMLMGFNERYEAEEDDTQKLLGATPLSGGHWPAVPTNSVRMPSSPSKIVHNHATV